MDTPDFTEVYARRILARILLMRVTEDVTFVANGDVELSVIVKALCLPTPPEAQGRRYTCIRHVAHKGRVTVTGFSITRIE